MSTSSDDMTVEVISNDNKSFTVPAKRLMQSKLLSFMIGDLFIEPKKIPEKKKKLIFQASISAIWRERNSRIFSTVSCSIQDIRKAVDRFLGDRLLSFPAPDSSSLSLLAFYFGCIPFV
ncbi:uncharacterized protein LOC9326520 [Arabidopsis lyrata subsp. lyrata]|uniref:uncharacterized protein LOC9326520 n=1 Tax=Arabidopsis lyrata subsp. lyrata TaxID=81972 RepID=UPI000A29ABB9|nr:uncharacterized protein LOC9326520 [Arabidopsis lyrata subsp. lyrata]|eukprot:XP_020869947.1 uncharacterized protein LOC9326520 [Arabidopsis lyrata subsp. lyrata]